MFFKFINYFACLFVCLLIERLLPFYVYLQFHKHFWYFRNIYLNIVYIQNLYIIFIIMIFSQFSMHVLLCLLSNIPPCRSVFCPVTFVARQQCLVWHLCGCPEQKNLMKIRHVRHGSNCSVWERKSQHWHLETFLLFLLNNEQSLSAWNTSSW